MEIVSYSDSDWTGCQRSRRSTSGSLTTLFPINIATTSQTQASVSLSSAKAELYAMTQAAVESLAIKHFIQEVKSAIFQEMSRSLSRRITQQGKTMASHLGISRESKHLEHLWIPDILSEAYLTRENVTIAIHQMYSRISFKLLFSVSISRSSIFSKVQVCLRCANVARVW